MFYCGDYVLYCGGCMLYCGGCMLYCGDYVLYCGGCMIYCGGCVLIPSLVRESEFTCNGGVLTIVISGFLTVFYSHEPPLKGF
jgi:hypothetical protein